MLFPSWGKFRSCHVQGMQINPIHPLIFFPYLILLPPRLLLLFPWQSCMYVNISNFMSFFSKVPFSFFPPLTSSPHLVFFISKKSKIRSNFQARHVKRFLFLRFADFKRVFFFVEDGGAKIWLFLFKFNEEKINIEFKKPRTRGSVFGSCRWC